MNYFNIKKTQNSNYFFFLKDMIRNHRNTWFFKFLQDVTQINKKMWILVFSLFYSSPYILHSRIPKYFVNTHRTRFENCCEDTFISHLEKQDIWKRFKQPIIISWVVWERSVTITRNMTIRYAMRNNMRVNPRDPAFQITSILSWSRLLL